MRPVAFAICLAWLLAPRGTADPLSQLNAIARKYQEIDSYESSVTARRPLGGGVFGQLHLEFACASARMTPKNLLIPMLPQVVRMHFSVIDKEGKPAQTNSGLAGPGPVFDFAQIAGALPTLAR